MLMRAMKHPAAGRSSPGTANKLVNGTPENTLDLPVAGSPISPSVRTMQILVRIRIGNMTCDGRSPGVIGEIRWPDDHILRET